MLTLCENVNAPLKLEKFEGLTTCLTFLGIQIDTNTMQASIPTEKKQILLDTFHSFQKRSKCTKRELLSLIGKLSFACKASFACKVVPAGRIFLHRLIDLTTSVKHLHHHLRLNKNAKLDIAWWIEFLPTWQGTAMILESEWTPSTSMSLFTDASGEHGWGAYWSGRWLQGQWSSSDTSQDIAWKELFAIVQAVNSWGHMWKRKKLLFHCDNHSIVDIWRKGSTRSPAIMALVRMLYFIAARYNFNVMITHIPGTCNLIADALSRFQNRHFHQLAPDAQPLPDHIPAWPTNLCTMSSINASS